jgi:MYXO-CTERM domain-containing protein
MYSFDEGSAQWVSEANGELQTADGKTIVESSLAAITGGTFTGDVFVSFRTSHFSSWNVDRPVQTHTCVKGRVVDQSGSAFAGLHVYAEGVSYTGTSATITTGADGFFVFDLMRSELPGENVNGDGKPGETVMARLQVNGNGGFFTSADFATPTAQLSAGTSGSPACKPADCSCVQLPDTTVTIQPPRACTVTVRTSYSGKSNSGSSLLATGAAVVGASITGELTGSGQGFVGSSNSICQNQTCNAGTSDTSGTATFVVPVIGNTPQLKLSATFEQAAGVNLHYYTGSLVVDGCVAGQASVAQTVQLQLDHVQLSAMASFIAALGSGPPPGAPGLGSAKSPLGCAMGAEPRAWSAGLFGVALFCAAAAARRRRK